MSNITRRTALAVPVTLPQHEKGFEQPPTAAITLI